MLKRIGSGIIIFVCFIVVLVAIAATGTPWVVRDRVAGVVTRVIDGADNSLEYAQNATDRVSTLLMTLSGFG
jgi:hypothetical protein